MATLYVDKTESKLGASIGLVCTAMNGPEVAHNGLLSTISKTFLLGSSIGNIGAVLHNWCPPMCSLRTESWGHTSGGPFFCLGHNFMIQGGVERILFFILLGHTIWTHPCLATR